MAAFGLNQIVARESARDPENTGRYLGHALLPKLVLSLGVLGILVAISRMNDDVVLRTVIPICAAENLIRVFFNVNLGIIRAYQRMELELLVSVVDSAVALAGVLFVVWFDLGIVAIFLAFLLSSVAQAIASVLIVWTKLSHPSTRQTPGLRRTLLKEAWPIGIALEMDLLYTRQRVVLLKQWRSLEVVGVFSACDRIYQFTSMVSDSLIAAFFPVLSKLARTSKRKLTDAFNFALKHTLFWGFMVSVGIWTFSDKIVAILLGPEFAIGV